MNQTRSAGVNTNYRTYARIRPINQSSQLIECISENVISVKNPKTNEKTSYSFTNVFDQSTSQETIWAHVVDPCITKVIEGHNSCILSYGQTGSGKSFTIFGEDDSYSIKGMSIFADGRRDQRGMIPRTVEFLLQKAKEAQEVHEFVITCSIAEIFVNQVRDLGAAYLTKTSTTDANFGNAKPVLNANALTSNYENQDLMITDNANGQVIVKDLAQIQIKSKNELHAMIAAAFNQRQRFSTDKNQIWGRAHTIFTLNLVQKSRESDNVHSNSTIQFVDLAGNEQIPQNLAQGHNFDEPILITRSLSELNKCLENIAKSSKQVQYRASKITHMLQNCLSVSSFVSLIVNLNPSANFEQCMYTLRYAENTKPQTSRTSLINNPNNPSQVAAGNMNMTGSGSGGASGNGNGQLDDLLVHMGSYNIGNEKLINQIKSLNETIEEQQRKIETIQKENKKLTEELTTLKQKREAETRQENEENEKKEKLREKIKELQSTIEKMEKVKQQEHSMQLIKLQEQVDWLQKQLKESKLKSEEEMQRFTAERDSEIKAMLDKSNGLLNEKISAITNLPANIQTKTNEAQRLNDLKRNTRHEVEKELQSKFDGLKLESNRLLETSKAQYEHFLKAKNDQIDAYVADMNKYRAKKNNELETSKQELLDLYDIVTLQNSILQKIEIGHYSGGKRSVNIPSREKPSQPTRTSFALLFKYLDQRQLKLLQNTSTSTMQLAPLSAKNAMMATSIVSPNNQMGTGTTNTMNVTFGGTTKQNGELGMMGTGSSSAGAATGEKGMGTIEMNKTKASTSTLMSKGLQTMKTLGMASTLLVNSAMKSQQVDKMQVDVSQLHLTEKDSKDKQLIMDINVDLTVNLNKMKSKEEFPQLKVYAERLKDSLQASLMREKELKERVSEFDRINNNVDIKTLQSERDEFKSLYMHELRKNTNNIASRGSSGTATTAGFSGTSRRFFMTSTHSQSTMTPQRATSPQGIYNKLNVNLIDSNTATNTNTISSGRPQTNSIITRQQKQSEKSLLPFFK